MLPDHISTENVPRNIFGLLCPVALCGAPGIDPTASLVNEPLVWLRAT